MITKTHKFALVWHPEEVDLAPGAYFYEDSLNDVCRAVGVPYDSPINDIVTAAQRLNDQHRHETSDKDGSRQRLARLREGLRKEASCAPESATDEDMILAVRKLREKLYDKTVTDKAAEIKEASKEIQLNRLRNAIADKLGVGYVTDEKLVAAIPSPTKQQQESTAQP